jgi:hypothetical protein
MTQRPQTRVRYHDGALLAARDLRADAAAQARARWRHVAVAHDAWGIALGLHAALAAGARVTVSPGLAYDRCGRELLLPEPVTLDVPAAGGVLVICAAGESEIDARGGVCLGDSPPLERAALVWRRPHEVRMGDEVPLGRVHAGAPMTWDVTARRYARPRARARVASGVAIIPWERWAVWLSSSDSAAPIGRQVRVDTSEAGFVAAPCYFAGPIPMPGGIANLTGLFVSIADVSPAGFTYRLLFGFNTGDLGPVELPSHLLASVFGTPAIPWTAIEAPTSEEMP